MAIGDGGREEMEKDFETKLRLQHSHGQQGSVQKSNTITFRAPQKPFSIDDFELGKIYGVGSYSKVRLCFYFYFSGQFALRFRLWHP